jgi:quercetin dioxygenase-like cupin family protein
VTLGPDTQEVQAGSWMWMEGGLPHRIEAETDLVLLLQVFLDDAHPRRPDTASAA